MACEPTKTPQDVDIPALREKYRQERDKRVRPDGASQYIEVANDLIDYYEADPHSPRIERDPIDEDLDVVVLGGGFAGLIASARLKEAGVTDLRIVEMAGDLGGTWYWNRYPGVQCDVESYTYLPLLEELGYVPRERYSHGPEIHEHCQRIGEHFGLYERALFGTIVRALRWDEALKRWRVSTDRGDELRARFVIVASGPLNKPKLPGIPGVRDFKGHSFHTARWDYDYTGGDTWGGLTKLADKRVAIIGTGATAIQCIPFLGAHARHLYVFQRTPSYVGERGNRPTDLAWAKSLPPGWQRTRQRSFHSGVFEGFASPEEDLVCDGWGEISRNLAARLNAMGNPQLAPDELMTMREEEDYKAMERLRRRVDTIVRDPATANVLKPWYKFLCKRPCFNDDYLATFNRPNVTLVDVSEARGVERITDDAVIANGTKYPVDCIVYASGFEVTENFKRRFGIETITGRDGVSLYDHWRTGFKTLHGIMTHGFPNLLFTGYTQNSTSAAINLMYDQQGSHIAYIVAETMRRRRDTVEPTEDAQTEWIRTIRDSAVSSASFWEECTPGYLNKEGEKVGPSPLYGEPYGPGFYAFDDLLREWRGSGDMPGMSLE